MKILITGIRSSIGSLLAKKLSKNHEVVGLGKRKISGIKTIIFDLGSDKDLDAGSFDACIHLAFVTDPLECKNNPEAYKVNILGTKKLLDYCKKIKAKKFIFVSTGGVYGFRDRALKESMKPRPLDAYSSMKHAAEKMSEKYKDYFDVTVLRYFFPYGPKTKENSLVNRLIKNINTFQEITLHRGGNPVINPIFITDLVDASCYFCLNKFEGFQIFNVAGKERISIKDLSIAISKIIGKKPIFRQSGKKCKDMVGSTTKLRKFYEPKIPLRKGLKMTIQQQLKNS